MENLAKQIAKGNYNITWDFLNGKMFEFLNHNFWMYLTRELKFPKWICQNCGLYSNESKPDGERYHHCDYGSGRFVPCHIWLARVWFDSKMVLKEGSFWKQLPHSIYKKKANK